MGRSRTGIIAALTVLLIGCYTEGRPLGTREQYTRYSSLELCEKIARSYPLAFEGREVVAGRVTKVRVYFAGELVRVDGECVPNKVRPCRP